MKILAAACILILSVMIISSPVFGDPAGFPSGGIDAQSLGRGGTVIAAPPGVWSSFGNPATLTPDGFYILGAEYLDPRNNGRESWGLSVVDTSSGIRGALSYYPDPEFAGFSKDMWGVSFCQTLFPTLYLGESFHMGEYVPSASPGTEESINTVDAGLLYKVSPDVSIGFVAHNLIPSDRDLQEQYNGYGLGVQLPMTVYLAADYEEDPEQNGENNIRTGFEFKPFKKITGRFGYQDRATGDTYLTMGITYTDINGTLDLAILYNNTEDRTEMVILGLSIRM